MLSDHICLLCPNGCHLSTDMRSEGVIAVQGNKCAKGLSFVQTVLKKANVGPLKIVPSDVTPAYDVSVLERIVASWGVSFRKTRLHLMPAGSPERTLFRMVIEDDHQRLFVLERISPSEYDAKERIIKTLEYLCGRGLSKVVPYLKDGNGRSIQEHPEGLWQMVPFIPGEVLDRETYLYEAWRAPVLAAFLVDLKASSSGMPFFSDSKRFSIKEYIYALLVQVKAHYPGILPSLNKVMVFLEQGFMPTHDLLPSAFCHGDYHPLNVIWGRDDIRAVIDWEFAGFKPEMYDLANMVGCLGIEHPSSLTRELVRGLTSGLKQAGIFKDMSWEHFLELVVALRFAWLSEWLRKRDEEMLAMELEYMGLLVDNKDELKAQWGIANN